MKRALMIVISAMFLAGCAELHQHNGKFSATGVSANLFFYQIPKDPMMLADEQVPDGATVTNVNSSPNEWKTVYGFLHRFLGISWAQIGGEVK
ncbi:hypothetical protein ACFL6Y_11275 [Elusimicrobiota bacterium]